jgi:hypothetical protein
MAHIFVSYSRADSHFARLLKLELEKTGFDLWVDTERLLVGEDWRQAIDEAIQGSDAMIVVKSPDSYESQYVTYEWAFALGIGVKIIPILVKSTKFHPRLEVIQYLDFTNPDPSHQPWGKLIERLGEMGSEHGFRLRIPRNAPPAVKKAIEAFDSYDPHERGSALGSLSQMSHPAAIEALIQALQHPTRDVRTIAAVMLAEDSKDVRSRPIILDMLKNGYTRERVEAAQVADKIWDEDVVNALIDRLSDNETERGLFRATGFDVRRVCDVAADTLTRIGTPEAVAAVEQWKREQGDHAGDNT